jgi:hypothetical protein
MKSQSRPQHFLHRLVGKFVVRTLFSVDFGRRYSLVLRWLEILFFREDSRLVRRAALKHHSARHGLGSKKVEQELTEGTEVLRLSLLPRVLGVWLRLCRAVFSSLR